jgi:SnoaL-like domain
MPYGADRRNDPRVMRELFVEDAVWHSEGFGVFRGRSEIIAGLREIASTRVSRTLNYMIAPLVDIASDRRQRPRSLASLGTRAFEGRPGSKFGPVMGGGDYTCRLVRIDGRWRFQHMRLNISTVVRYSAIGTPSKSQRRARAPLKIVNM